MLNKIINIDCEKFLENYEGEKFDLTFLDPPLTNQNTIEVITITFLLIIIGAG